MESEFAETVKEEQDSSSQDCSSADMKTDIEDGSPKDVNKSKQVMERDMHDGEALKKPPLPAEAESNFERESEETNMEEHFELADNTEGMGSIEDAMKGDQKDTEVLMEPVFVPVRVDFEQASEDFIKKEIFEETESTEDKDCHDDAMKKHEDDDDDDTEALMEPEFIPVNVFEGTSQETEEVSEATESFEDSTTGATILRGGKRSKPQTPNIEKCFKCVICEKTFKRNFALVTHMRRHSGEKPYRCTECGAGFTQSTNLNTHMRLHSGEKPFVCSLCGKAFAQSGHLSYHLRSHAGEMPYTCTVCGRSFASKTNRTVHMRSHTGEKPYLCTVCGKAFSQNSALHTHMRIHTRERPYACSHCQNCFTTLGNLQRHRRDVHEDPSPIL